MTNVLAKPQPQKIILGDGKEYTLSPANLYLWGELEEEYNCSMIELLKKLESRMAQPLAKFLYVFIKENHPEVDSPRKAGELVINAAQMNAVADIFLKTLREFSGES